MSTGQTTRAQPGNGFARYILNHETPVDPPLQQELEQIDVRLRGQLAMSSDQVALGLLDLNSLRLAMIHPDRLEYAASLAKVGILLAYFHHRPQLAAALDPETRHQLGLMIKASSNEMATRFSRELGLAAIQQAIDSYGLYDLERGGGLWVGKHYGDTSERRGDPLGDNSHAVTVRQLLRFYLLLEQGKLVSPEASTVMRDIFDSPDIPHDNIKFIKGLQGRGVTLRRKWGSWEDWLHDSAVVTGSGRHYILICLTHHPKGDEYLERLAPAVDDLLLASG